jgi:hypothetical protein
LQTLSLMNRNSAAPFVVLGCVKQLIKRDSNPQVRRPYLKIAAHHMLRNSLLGYFQFLIGGGYL